jgi:hypothetical protein
MKIKYLTRINNFNMLAGKLKMGTGGPFPGLKRQGREAGHSPPTSAEVKKCGSIHSLPYMS